MLVIQQNFGKGYEYIISIQKSALNLGELIVYIQKPFIGN